MATTHSAPIDLYEESHEGLEQERPETGRHETEGRRPDGNGDRDEPAIDAGQGRLDQVLGW